MRSNSGTHFPTFGLNTERYSIGYSVSLRIQLECGKMRNRVTPNTDTFYAVNDLAGIIFRKFILPKFLYLNV